MIRLLIFLVSLAGFIFFQSSTGIHFASAVYGGGQFHYKLNY